jgi:hypothetical protein
MNAWITCINLLGAAFKFLGLRAHMELIGIQTLWVLDVTKYSIFIAFLR